jgi:hypothetical protein
MQLELRTADPLGRWSAALPIELDSPRTLVVAFGSSRLADEAALVRSVGSAFPQSKVVGCSTAGEISGTTVSDGGVSLAVARFDDTRLRMARVPITEAAHSRQAGQAIAQQLSDPSLRAVFVLSAGLGVNGSELVRGLNSALDSSVVVTGGMAGDGDRFQRTWVLSGDSVKDQTVVAVGLYGDHVRVGHGSKGGWDVFGPERRVTRSVGNVLYELDDRPALELYKRYLGDRAAGLPATALLFPLALRADATSTAKQVVRTILAVDEAQQSLIFAGDVPQGSLAQLMQANFDRLIDGAAGAGGSARLKDEQEGPVLSVAISCVGRRLILGERIEEELEAARDALPEGTQQIGFYSYGEISPLASGSCELHNQTMTLTTVAEA